MNNDNEDDVSIMRIKVIVEFLFLRDNGTLEEVSY